MIRGYILYGLEIKMRGLFLKYQNKVVILQAFKKSEVY